MNVGLNSELIESLEGSHDLAAWINTHLGNDSEDLTDLIEVDRRVGQLATSLELSYQDISNEVEQTLDTTTRTIPRVTFELQFMHESTLNLQSLLQKGKEAPESLRPESGGDIDQVLGRLRELDSIQRNMTAARHILQETESWKSLEAEVSNYMSSTDVRSFQKAALRLSEAEKSLPIFQDTPEYESRKLLLTNLENQLEATLSTSLVEAASSNNIVLCRDYYQIFVRINREADFRTYYNGARWAELVSLWNDTKIRDCGEVDPEYVNSVDEFATFFRRFLIVFESLVAEERSLQAKIFSDPLESVTSFIQSVFDTISPPLTQRLESLLVTRGANGLIILIDVYQSAQQFVQSLSNMMSKLALHSSISSEQTFGMEQSPSLVNKRRRSSRWSSFSRKSFSGISAPLDTKGLTWESAILEPFLEHQTGYGKLEAAYMLQLLPEPSESNRSTSFITRERECRELQVDVFSRAEGSLGRCSALTSGYGVVGLIEANRNLLTEFVYSIENSLTQITADPTSSLPLGLSQLNDFDYTVQDWTKIQPCVRLLDTARGIYERSRALDSRLAHFVSSTCKELCEDLSLQGMLAKEMSRPDIQLLSQSALNSMNLRELFSLAIHNKEGPQSKEEWRLLGQVQNTLKVFVKKVQAMTGEIILSTLFSHFDVYPSLTVWTRKPKEQDFELRTPSFSISPTATVQRVTEALLKLPGLFEAYADDDALAFCIELLPYVSSEGEGNIHAGEVLDPDEITATWLSSLTVMLLNHLTSQTLPRMPGLTNEGSKQLAADLDYLSNIVQAFNVRWSELEIWKEMVQMDANSAASFVTSDDRVEKIFRKVASLRGWSTAVY